MDIAPQIYTAKVMHKRIFPKVNQFVYGVYYLALPLSALSSLGRLFAVNKSGLLSFYDKDHGARDGTSVGSWARGILQHCGLDKVTQHIMLITMPRVVGYVFNPVSFYLCLDERRQLRAVICQVHNTFGEQHSYVCARADHAPLSGDEWLEAEKLFHVSPFLERSGHYRFRFALHESQLGIWIDYYDQAQNKQLITSLIGTLTPMTRTNLIRVVAAHPLVTLKTIMLIHYQALKLVSKGIRYIVKPVQLSQRLSKTDNLTKM